MTQERQEALDHFNRFLDLIDLYEAQTWNAIEDGSTPFDIYRKVSEHTAEVGHALINALPSTTACLPLMEKVLRGVSQSYADTMRQIIDEIEKEGADHDTV